jgi:hypothetical protein
VGKRKPQQHRAKTASAREPGPVRANSGDGARRVAVAKASQTSWWHNVQYPGCSEFPGLPRGRTR